MSLKLMYITNRIDIAKIAQHSGVDRIFIDMEYIGKEERQSDLDCVKNHHSLFDIEKMRKVLNRSQLLVRINPIHEETKLYSSSKEEIENVVTAGADIIMLPMAKNAEELKRFVSWVNGRARTIFLLETAEACDNIEAILDVEGINEVHIGLNDLHLAKHKKFMFELLSDGTVEYLCKKIRAKGLPYGFGGIARLGYGLVPAENVITEHYRLGSSMAILSREFCNVNKINDINIIHRVFCEEIEKIRKYEKYAEKFTLEQFEDNRRNVVKRVADIAKVLEK